MTVYICFNSFIKKNLNIDIQMVFKCSNLFTLSQFSTLQLSVFTCDLRSAADRVTFWYFTLSSPWSRLSSSSFCKHIQWAFSPFRECGQGRIGKNHAVLNKNWEIGCFFLVTIILKLKLNRFLILYKQRDNLYNWIGKYTVRMLTLGNFRKNIYFLRLAEFPQI